MPSSAGSLCIGWPSNTSQSTVGWLRGSMHPRLSKLTTPPRHSGDSPSALGNLAMPTPRRPLMRQKNGKNHYLFVDGSSPTLSGRASAFTLARPRVRKPPPAVIRLMVPNGCSAAHRRWRMRLGSALTRAFILCSAPSWKWRFKKAPCGSRAARLEGTSRTVLRGIENAIVPPHYLPAHQHAPCRARISVVIRLVHKGRSIEQRAVTLVVDRTVRRHAR